MRIAAWIAALAPATIVGSDMAGATAAGTTASAAGVGPDGLASDVAVRVHAFDAETGAAIDGRWAPDGSRWTLVNLDDVEEGVSPPRWGLPTTEAATVPLGAGRSARSRLVFDLPPRWVTWDQPGFDGVLAAGVREVVVHVPLRHALTLEVTVLGPDGRAADGATIAALWVGGRRHPLGAFAVGVDGVARIDRIPFLPGEPVVGEVDWQREPGAITVESVENGPFADAPLKTRVPDDRTAPWAVTVRLRGPTAYVTDHNETDQDVAEAPRPEPPSGARGTVRVRVLDRDGGPIAGADVQVGSVAGRSGADGLLTLEDVPAGTQRVVARADGHFPTGGEVVVTGGRTAGVEVREARGATLDVLVVDADGRGRTAARCDVVTAGSIAPFDVADGVQRLDAFTDARGRRTFARVAPGTVTLTAKWGSHRAVVTRDVRDGERASVRIELP